MKKLGSVALGVALACSLCPAAPAFAGDAMGTSSAAIVAALGPGTYVEHEAIAYVVGSAQRSFSLLSLFGVDILAGAQDLMGVDAQAARESLDDDADAAVQPALMSARSAGAEESGKLVLVRDESKTTAELIAALEADSRVVFAEPNAVIENLAAEDDAAAQAAARLAGAASAEDEAAAASNDEPVKGNQAANGNAGMEVGSVNAGASAAADNIAGDAQTAKDSAGITFGHDLDEPAGDINSFVWGFGNDGHMGGVSADEAIDTDYDAWKAQQADASLNKVVVAVFDSGIDVANPDLAPVMWETSDESLLALKGADRYGFSSDPAGSSWDASTMPYYHGTHVAGTIGAAWNGEGISGQASNVELMSVRCGSSLGQTIESFDYVSHAIDAGANVRVANHSWGFGQGCWRTIDLAVAQLGQKGVTSVFAAGNSSNDTDSAMNTATILADNPYVIVVNALDPTGDMTMFTQYGETTTDLAAAGGSVLSTTFASAPNYLAEEDDDAVLYQSFDAENSQAAADGSALDGDAFAFIGSSAGFPAVVRTDVPTFDGDGALTVRYDPTATGGEADSIASEYLDFSGVAEKPTSLSLRYTTIDAACESGFPSVRVYIEETREDDKTGWLELDRKGGFGYGLGSWGGAFYDIPQDVDIDWQHFRLRLTYDIYDFDELGGSSVWGGAAAGTMVFDSIGFGSDKVPYTYMQGTSMACPATAGVAAVLAGTGKADVEGDAAKSAEKLTALTRAAAQPVVHLEGTSSTGGYATVSGMNNPGPAITKAADADESVLIEGYYFTDDTAVEVDGMAAAVTTREDVGGGKARLTVAKPESFAGGQVVVRVRNASGKESRYRVDLGKRVDTTYYDQTNLPVPEEMTSWGSWQLVGFAGDVYALPRDSFADQVTFDHLLAYDPQAGTWSKVPFPSDEQLSAAGVRSISDVTAVTYDGGLLVALSDFKATEKMALFRYNADGTWEPASASFSFESGLTLGGTLACDGSSVYWFSGTDVETASDSTAIWRLPFGDAADSELEKVGDLQVACGRPQVSYGNGQFLVSNGYQLSIQTGGRSGAELVAIADDQVKSETVITSHLVTETGQLAYGNAAVADGFMLVGPEADDGATDTYTLAAGDAKASAYEKRAAQQKLMTPSAVAYEGTLYVLASTQTEPYRVFSATAVKTVAQPGDYVAPDPEPEPELTPDPEPSPDPEPEVNPGGGSGSGNGAPTTQTSANAGEGTALAKTGDATVPFAAAFGGLAVVVAAVAVATRRVLRKRDE